jgi:hypothetical protein
MIRQRIPQASKASQQTTATSRVDTPAKSLDVSRGSRASWEITSDDSDVDETSAAIPMYNPLHYDRNYRPNIPAPPGSFPMTWRQQPHEHHHSIPGAPSSMSGLRELASLTPAGIPDSSYQAYLMGRPLKKKREAVVDKICFAKFCAGFSWVAVMFLVFVGILLDTQPIFIQGALPQHVQFTTGDRKQQVFYSISPSERLAPASHAYQAAFGYFLTGCLSLAYAYNWGWWIKTRMWTGHHDIPDADSTIPTFHYNDEGDILPTTMPSSPMMRAYQYNNRLSARIWEKISLTMNRMRAMWPQNQQQRRARRRQAGAKEI